MVEHGLNFAVDGGGLGVVLAGEFGQQEAGVVEGGVEHGVEELFEQEEEDKDGNTYKVICIYGDYSSYGSIQKYLEENGYELISGGFEQIPNVDLKEVTPEQRLTLDKLTGLLEDDEDVTNVYSTLKPADE